MDIPPAYSISGMAYALDAENLHNELVKLVYSAQSWIYVLIAAGRSHYFTRPLLDDIAQLLLESEADKLEFDSNKSLMLDDLLDFYESAVDHLTTFEAAVLAGEFNNKEVAYLHVYAHQLAVYFRFMVAGLQVALDRSVSDEGAVATLQ